MAGELTLILLIFGTLFFLVSGFFFYWVLTNHNLRVMLMASIPFMRRGRVMDFHFINDRTYKLSLVDVVGNELQAKRIKDGQEVLKNKKIEKGTFWKDLTSGTMTFFTADGVPSTFDPTATMQNMDFNVDTMLTAAFDTGSQWNKLLTNMTPNDQLKGWPLAVVIILGLVFVAALVGVLFSVNGQIAVLTEAVLELRELMV